MQIDPFSNNQPPSNSVILTTVHVKHNMCPHTTTDTANANMDMKNMYLYHGYSVAIPFTPHKTRLSSVIKKD